MWFMDFILTIDFIPLFQSGNANTWFLGEGLVSLLALVLCLPQGANTDLLNSMDRWVTPAVWVWAESMSSSSLLSRINTHILTHWWWLPCKAPTYPSGTTRGSVHNRHNHTGHEDQSRDLLFTGCPLSLPSYATPRKWLFYYNQTQLNYGQACTAPIRTFSSPTLSNAVFSLRRVMESLNLLRYLFLKDKELRDTVSQLKLTAAKKPDHWTN